MRRCTDARMHGCTDARMHGSTEGTKARMHECAMHEATTNDQRPTTNDQPESAGSSMRCRAGLR